MRKKIIFGLKISVVVCIIALTALIYWQKGDFTSLDLGRHLKNGQVVLNEPQVLFKNFYSFTEPDFLFINHHWLAGVVFYRLYSIGGFKILTLLNVLLGIAAVLIIFKLAVRKSNFTLAAILALPVILLLSERVDVRPEMFSYLLIAITYYLLEDFRAGGKTSRLIWLIPVFLLWVNLHIYFFVGLFLIVLVLFERIILRRPAKKIFYVTVAALTVSFINPNFAKAALYPFNILKKYGYEIVENKSPFYLENLMIDYNILIFKILLALLILSFVLFFSVKRGLNFYHLILAAAFSAFAILYIRNLPLFGLAVLPIMAGNFHGSVKTDIFVKHELKLAALALALLAAAAGFIVSDNLNGRNFLKNSGWGMSANSLQSIEFYRANNLSGPVFNNYDLGGALIFWLYPREKVFVDNRPEAYSIEFFSQIYKPMMQDDDEWKELSGRYGINLIYLSHADGTPWARRFLAAKLNDGDWPLVYFDDYTVIMLKNSDSNQAVIEKYGIDGEKFAARLSELLKSASYDEKLRLADLAMVYGRTDLAENIYFDLLARVPADGRVLASLGYLYAGGQVLKSISYLDKALSSGYKLPAVYNQLGLDYWSLADYNEAKKMWREALKLDGGNEHAKYYLKQAYDNYK